MRYSFRSSMRVDLQHIHQKAFVFAGAFAIAAGALGLVVMAPAAAFGSHTLYVSSSGQSSSNDRGCSSAGYSTVQSAVNAATNGDTVYLCGGQYAEQVFVGKSITLTGDKGSGLTAVGTTFSTDPTGYPAVFMTDGLRVPQALLVTTSNNVTVQGLSLSGPVSGTSGCGSDEYGVLALSGSVNLRNDTLANIADANTSLYGCQMGVAVQVGKLYWDGATKVNLSAHASIANVTITGYQKNGIAVDNTGSSADITNTTIVGGGAGTPFGSIIAQNGVEIVRGATGTVTDSTIASNAYSGAGEATAAGVLVYGGYAYGQDSPNVDAVKVTNNKFVNNDVAVDFVNYNHDASMAGPNGQASSPTNDVARNNWIFSSSVTNTSGLVANNGVFGYQAGIQDVGDGDSACNNTIVGPGYTDEGSFDAATNIATPGSNNAVTRDIDAGYTYPTTDFDACDYGHNYGGSNFGQSFFDFNNSKYDHDQQ